MSTNKTLAIIMISYFLFMAIGLSIESYNRHKCKIAYVNSGKTVAEIKELCE